MMLTVEVPPDVEAGLLAQAEAQGLDMPSYVENVLRREAMAQPPAEVFRPAAELTFEGVPTAHLVAAMRIYGLQKILTLTAMISSAILAFPC